MSSRLKGNYKGIGELLRDPAVVDIVDQQASAIYSRTGGAPSGYFVDNFKGRHRRVRSIWAGSKAATQDNLDNNTLLKAIGGG